MLMLLPMLLLLLPASHHHSSALDKFQNSFWSRQFRPLAAKDNSGKDADVTSNLATDSNAGKNVGAANSKQVRTTAPNSDVVPLHYANGRPRYGRNDRYEPVDDERPHNGDNGKKHGNWPECRGTCDNGKCQLEKHYSGCRYLADSHGQNEYPAIDSEQAEVDSTVDSSEKIVALNARAKRGMRVCW
jgi:hypothetical protein